MDSTSQPNAAAAGPEPQCALLAMCCQCGDGIEVALPIDQRSLSLRLAQNGWFVSVLTPPDQGPEVPLLFGALCTACAQTTYPPEVFQIAEQRRQEMLQTTAQGGTR